MKCIKKLSNGFFLQFINLIKRHYLLVLSLCHTVIIEEIDGKRNYNAASPDELALL